MKEDDLTDYAECELQKGQELLSRLDSNATLQTRLRSLYGIDKCLDTIYAESGGLQNIHYFPNKLVIIPILPYRTEAELENSIGDISQLRSAIDSGQVYPIIQNPLYYKELPHLNFLFAANAPSYFIRGLYAYAAILGLEPTIECSELTGTPVLKAIAIHMSYCESNHRQWLQQAVDTPSSWEYRYRQIGVQNQDQVFLNRLRQSLCYRYASVSIILGQGVTDRIINSFPHRDASRILLHLHILFDHFICHGAGADFVVHSQSPEGTDYIDSGRTGIMQLQKYSIPSTFSVDLPDNPDQFTKNMIREEHFLREIDVKLHSLSLDSPASVAELQATLNQQFDIFQNRMQQVRKTKHMVKHTFEFSLLVLGFSEILGGSTTLGMAKIVAGLKVPWLVDVVANTCELLFRHRLANYIITKTKL
jgi:hypothetical protein